MKRLMGFMLLCLMLIMGVNAQEDTRLVILESDTADFRDISLDLLVLQNEQAVRGLSSNNISISEPTANLTVTELADRPVAMVILVDLTIGSNDALIRQTLRAYVDTYYRPDDILVFYIMDSTTPRRVQVNNQTEAVNLINSLSSSTNTFRVNDALPNVASELNTISSAYPNYVRHALLVGTLMYSTRTDNAASIPVPMDVIQAGSRPDSLEAYTRIATTTGGRFISDPSGQLSANQGESVVASNELATLFDRINHNRTHYLVNYRSINQDLAPTRNVTVTVQLPDGSLVTQTFNYSPQFEPPTVEFINTNFTPSREFLPGGDNTTFDNPNTTIMLQVDFPDDVPRDLTNVKVEIIDADTENIIQTIVPDTFILDSANRISVTWDLRGFNTPASTTRLILRAFVEDELGLSASTEHTGEVRVAQIPPTSTPAPTNTPPPTNTPVPTNTPEAVNIGGVVELDAETATPVILSLGVGVIILTIVTIFLLFTRPGKAIVQQGGVFAKTMVAGATQIFGVSHSPVDEAFNPTGPVYGEIQILQGMNQGQIIPINRERFVIGRELAAGCDYAIPQPFVSAKHCEINTRGGQSWIKDLGSANRTYLDGVPLIPDQEMPLRDGSTIGISSHIQIRFNAAKPAQSTGGWGSQKTQLDYSQKTQLDQPAFGNPPEQPTQINFPGVSKPPMEQPTQIDFPGVSKPPMEQPTQLDMSPPREEPTQIFSAPSSPNFAPDTQPEPADTWLDDPTLIGADDSAQAEEEMPDGIDPDTQYSQDRGLEGNRPSQGRRNAEDFDLSDDNQNNPPVDDDWEI